MSLGVGLLGLGMEAGFGVGGLFLLGGWNSWEGEGRESVSEFDSGSNSELGFGFGFGERCSSMAAVVFRGGGVRDLGWDGGGGDEEMRMGCSNEVGRVLLFCSGLRARRRVGDLLEGLAETCEGDVLTEGRRLVFLEGDGDLAWLDREKGLIEDVGAGIGSVTFSLVLRLVGVLEARI